MKRRNLLTIAGLMVCLWANGSLAAPIPRDVSLAPLVKQVSPAVVNISTRGTVEVQQEPRFQIPGFRPFRQDQPREREVSSLGSGVIVNASVGHVLTNFHVVREADHITIGLIDGRQFDATVIGTDEASDVALLKIDPDDLTELPIGSSDSLEVGDYVLALGNPFGLGHTVTSGIVSAKGRSGLGIESYEDFIQTDAAINRGNSGGALINLQGELVGINTAILGPGGGNSGIGFAIPSRMARTVMDQILEFGEVKRGLLGVRGQELTPDVAKSLGLDHIQGAIISEVMDDSAARAAGLKIYDVIIKADGRRVGDFLGLRNIIGLKRPGDAVVLTVVRDGKEFEVETILGDNLTTSIASSDGVEDPEEVAPEVEASDRIPGVALVEIPSGHPLLDEVDGVMVDRVAPGSTAERKGLRRGDVITSINRHDIRSLADVPSASRDTESLMLRVQRGDSPSIVVIE